jgi:ankyrin repeat protein
MPDLPVRVDLRQLRTQAKELLKQARGGDDAALARIEAVSDELMLASAQLAIAREYGFPSWTRLKTEVERRELLNRRDLAGLRALLDEHPELAVESLEHWCDHKRGATPLGYMAMLRFDAPRLGLPPVADGIDEVTRMLVEHGAPVEGEPDDRETPLITAASYGDAEVARVLIEAGADIDALAADDSGGVPGGSALLHAGVFGNTEVVDVLAAAGARVRSVVEAAAVGDIDAWLTAETRFEERVRAMTMAAGHDRVSVIEQLLAAGTPVDAVDAWGFSALRAAAENGHPASVQLLLAAGADPNQRDPDENLTPLERFRRNDPDEHPARAARHEQVEQLLEAAAAER